MFIVVIYSYKTLAIINKGWIVFYWLFFILFFLLCCRFNSLYLSLLIQLLPITFYCITLYINKLLFYCSCFFLI